MVASRPRSAVGRRGAASSAGEGRWNWKGRPLEGSSRYREEMARDWRPGRRAGSCWTRPRFLVAQWTMVRSARPWEGSLWPGGRDSLVSSR